MNYNQGVQHMMKFVGKRGSFNPYQGITINYPGYKKKGDYKLTFNGKSAPTHSDICSILYNLINNNNFNFQELQNFLSDVYDNGTNTTYQNSTLELLKHLIYWITLQEEINYPRAKNFAGINLPFCRFFEAIYATLNTNSVDLEQVQYRCNNHGRNKPVLYPILDAPAFYHY
ncbi:hypothetical protein [Paraclostridium sordellii]|uniref:hypothetical protein n=1 Tax=Paraclostridium sordellii TaxID=1505 RepID=UPI0022E791D7|nr:hypothetical protein [Paeniclostridium sordellii]